MEKYPVFKINEIQADILAACYDFLDINQSLDFTPYICHVLQGLQGDPLQTNRVGHPHENSMCRVVESAVPIRRTDGSLRLGSVRADAADLERRICYALGPRRPVLSDPSDSRRFTDRMTWIEKILEHNGYYLHNLDDDG